MKTYLRGFKITRELVLQAVEDWNNGTSGKKDAGRYIASCGGADALAEMLFDEVASRSVTLDPLMFRDRVEPTNGKVRRIGIQSPKQQIYDYVVIASLRPMFERHFGYYQCASLPKKGQVFVKRHVAKWAREPSSKYFVKLDMKGYYPNCDQEMIIGLLEKYVASDDVIYLIKCLMSNYTGLNIGSNLCMYLATWLMSFLYHHIEGMAKTRRCKQTRMMSHFCMYMDDILVIGPSKRNLKLVCREIERFARDAMHCTVKPWKVCKIGFEPIDICGFRMHGDHVTVRKRTFKRCKRAFLRYARHPCCKRAMRCASYFGFLKHSDSDAFVRNNSVQMIFRRARREISERSNENAINKTA